MIVEVEAKRIVWPVDRLRNKYMDNIDSLIIIGLYYWFFRQNVVCDGSHENMMASEQSSIEQSINIDRYYRTCPEICNCLKCKSGKYGMTYNNWTLRIHSSILVIFEFSGKAPSAS